MADEAPRGGGPPFEVARAALAAMAEGRVADVIAVTDPNVVVMPVSRPALTVYHGHAALAGLVADLHAVWGKYRLVAEDAGAQADPGGDEERVTLRLRVVQSDRGDGEWPAILTEFTVRGGLITVIESRYEDEG
jgi:hypothetical protein